VRRLWVPAATGVAGALVLIAAEASWLQVAAAAMLVAVGVAFPALAVRAEAARDG
jgi:hypothetical protein